ncbi:MAG: PatB family C-S lyase [Desulfobacterales bacterium]
MGFDFDKTIDRRHTSSMKWDKYKGKDILPLWVADMDFRSPPAVIDALHDSIDHGVFGYGEPPEALVDTVLWMLEKDHGWKIEAEWIIWIPGLVAGLNVACRAIGTSGDDILTTVPIYPPFLDAPGFSDRNLVTTPLIREGDHWGFDFDHLKAAITPRTRLFMLCNPHNPSGRVLTKKELTTLTDICEEHDISICSDEIHCGLILDADKRHIPTATVSPQTARRTITLMAPSKTYNLPGLGCSFAIISDSPLRQHFRQAMKGIVPSVTIPGYAAALAAYRQGHQWHTALLDYLRNNRNTVIATVNTMDGLSVGRIEATYLAWIDTRDTGIDDPVTFFEDAGIGLSDGAEFGSPGFVRLNFGCPRSTLNEALKRMKEAMEGYRHESKR